MFNSSNLCFALKDIFCCKTAVKQVIRLASDFVTEKLINKPLKSLKSNFQTSVKYVRKHLQGVQKPKTRCTPRSYCSSRGDEIWMNWAITNIKNEDQRSIMLLIFTVSGLHKEPRFLGTLNLLMVCYLCIEGPRRFPRGFALLHVPKDSIRFCVVTFERSSI